MSAAPWVMLPLAVEPANSRQPINARLEQPVRNRILVIGMEAGPLPVPPANGWYEW